MPPIEDELQIVRQRIEHLLGKKITAVKSAKGGYTSAHRLLIDFADNSRVFAKVARDELTAGWLRQEYVVYESLKGDFMAAMLCWDDKAIWESGCTGQPILILEDLSAGCWNIEWSESSVDRVMAMLSRVRSSPCPQGIPELESTRDELVSWHLVAKDPTRFLSFGLCSEAWLKQALPRLIAAEDAAVLCGSELIHLDVRSDNLCAIGERIVLVDWNWVCKGNAKLDIVAWLPSVHAEGGPKPDTVLSGEPELVALIAGFWAHRAGLPPFVPDNGLRKLQLKLLKVTLPWCVRTLGLEPLDM